MLSFNKEYLQFSMATYFNSITDANKLTLNKQAGADVVYYSELNEWFTANAFRSFSLKYVVDQCIHYKVGSREYPVKEGNFLLACQQPHVKAYFDSKTIVRSICIDICPATVAEAFTIMSASGDYAFDNYQARHFSYPEFFEAVCPAGGSAFARKLDRLVAAIREHTADELINREWFLDLAEKIICHEYGNYLALNGLHSVKLETRKELLHRLNAGKQYIDEQLVNISSIQQVALVSNMSEFHFFRSFRQAYGITPYQYLLHKRLDLARELILKKDMSVTAISLHCNFPDLFTFSKAFKRRFGFPPSKLQEHCSK